MKTTKQSSFVDIITNKELDYKITNIINFIDYEHRIKNISLKDAEKRVFNRLGYIKTKPGIGMFGTKKTKSVNFLDKKGKIVAIYNTTIRDFWWT